MDGEGIASFCEVGLVDLVEKMIVHEHHQRHSEIDSDKKGQVTDDNGKASQCEVTNLREKYGTPTALEKIEDKGARET